MGLGIAVRIASDTKQLVISFTPTTGAVLLREPAACLLDLVIKLLESVITVVRLVMLGSLGFFGLQH